MDTGNPAGGARAAGLRVPVTLRLAEPLVLVGASDVRPLSSSAGSGISTASNSQ
jgi:hypothetical protein